MGLPSFAEYVATIDRLAPLLLDIAARSVVILGLAGLAALAMRRASAAARHWVWLLGFAGLLLLPALLILLPGWRVLPRVEINRTAPLASLTIVEPSLPQAIEPVQSVARSEPRATNAPTESPTVSQSKAALVPAAAPLQGGGRTPPAERAAPTPIAPRTALPWTFWLVVGWFIGTGLVLGHMLLGYLSLWFLQRRCSRINEGNWADLLRQLRQELQVRGAVQLLSSPLRTMPMTWGLWRTRLLLPEEAADWSPEQRRSVLLHELGHVRRCDCLTQLLAKIACAMYWFNPMVWVGWRRMQVERERACDDLVLNAGARASAYAEHLLHSASAMPTLRFVGAAALAMARASTLEERLRAILDAKRNRRALTISGALIATLLLVCALVPVAALKAQENPTPQPANPNPSLEEQMRQRREAQAAPAVDSNPTTRPANAFDPGTAVFGGGGGSRARGSDGTTAARGGGGFASDGGGRVGARGGPAAARGPRFPVAAPGEGPTCALDGTIYDVHLPGNQIGRLDMDALARAATTPEAFEKALAELGTARPLYRANQSIRLAGDSITIGTTQPYISNSQVTARGQTINTVAYSNVGFTFDIAGKASSPDNIDLDLIMQVSTLSESTTAVTTNVNAPVFHTVSMSRKGPVKANQPFVVMSLDAAAVGPDGQAVAYIARMTLGTPQFPAGAARGE